MKYYRISELSKLASVPISTIRFYLRDGLLPPAIKTGKTSAYYNDNHLDRLLLIKELKSNGKRTLGSIKDELSGLPLKSEPDDGLAIISSEKKTGIISAAINVFLKKGLGETSIDDIVNEANIGKGTFYKYFRDKNDLFIQCADSIFYEMYRNIWEDIKNEKDMTKRLVKRCYAFFDSYPRWIDMMNLVRLSSVGMNHFFKDKFRAVLNQIIKPIAREIEQLQGEGRVSGKFSSNTLAYILMGIAEYGALLIQTGRYTPDTILQSITDLASNGINKKIDR